MEGLGRPGSSCFVLKKYYTPFDADYRIRHDKTLNSKIEATFRAAFRSSPQLRYSKYSGILPIEHTPNWGISSYVTFVFRRSLYFTERNLKKSLKTKEKPQRGRRNARPLVSSLNICVNATIWQKCRVGISKPMRRLVWNRTKPVLRPDKYGRLKKLQSRH